MTLARTLGFVTRQRMYAALTAEELIELESAYAIDPWGPERLERIIGELCSLTDACHRTKGLAEPPLKYMPFVRQLAGELRQSDEDMQAIWEHAVSQWNS